ncbi:MAG: peptidoglycan DD-metalloendopeptidase family protein [Sciscionella sp.]
MKTIGRVLGLALCAGLATGGLTPAQWLGRVEGATALRAERTSTSARPPEGLHRRHRPSAGDEVNHERFTWPLPSPHPVLREFLAPSNPYGPGHRGVDLGGVLGGTVYAAGAGTVHFAGWVVDRPVVSIDHPGGLRTTYEPVDPSVHAGQVLAKGQAIGTLRGGHPGCGAVACLHWGARRGNAYLDPLALLGLLRVRLLPWDTPGPVAIGASSRGGALRRARR